MLSEQQQTSPEADTVRTTPYWWEAAPRSREPETPLPQKADIVIVGSGFAGTSAAIVLARAGRSVHIIERDRPGEGASSRNAGMASGTLRLSFGQMIDMYGLEQAKSYYDEGRIARDDIARFIADENIDCDWQPCGRFTAAVRPHHYDRMGRETDLLNRHLDFGAKMVPREEQHTETGCESYHGGVVRQDIAAIHPGKFHLGALERAREAGVTVHGETEVTGIRRDGEGHEVQTTRGRIAAREVIVATNGYTGRATPWLQRRIVPVPSQIVATAPLAPEVMDRIMPKRRVHGETRRLYNYYRPSPDGTRLLFGGRVATTLKDPALRHRHLRNRIASVFPELEGVEITHSWWGYTAFTLDFLPRLDSHDGVHYVAGFCGSGIVWSRWLAIKTALGIVGNQPPETAFSGGYSTNPLYRGRTWFLPLVYLWTGFRDMIDRG